jgi:hypothetical protein
MSPDGCPFGDDVESKVLGVELFVLATARLPMAYEAKPPAPTYCKKRRRDILCMPWTDVPRFIARRLLVYAPSPPLPQTTAISLTLRLT